MKRSSLAIIGVVAMTMAITAMAAGLIVSSERVPQDRAWMRGPTSAQDASGDGPRWRRMPVDNLMGGAIARSEFAYLAEMIAHHEEAVAAARELRRSDRAQMREFGAAIVASQSAQIQQMSAWLAAWYPQRSSDVNYRPMMRDLSGLSGDSLDRAFLTDMIGHHMMAVMMSQRLLLHGAADHDAVATLAMTIRDEQLNEIFRMRDWLTEWFGVAGGHYGWRYGMGMMTPRCPTAKVPLDSRRP